jgi:hypothetical protein
MTKSEMVDLIQNCILKSGCTRCPYSKRNSEFEYSKCMVYMLKDIVDLLESMDDDPDPEEHPDKKPAPDHQEPTGKKAERVFPAHNLNFSDYIDLSRIVYIEEMDTNRDPFRVFLDGKEAPLLISNEDTGLALVEAWKRYLEEQK